MSDPRDRFVINRLRSKPITYTVELTHLVIEGEWMLQAVVHDVSMENDDERARVAADLREAADMLEGVNRQLLVRATDATFLGYRDAEGNEVHCSRETCTECGVCKNPISKPGTQKRDPGNVVPAVPPKA